jgi:hypothetical protein
MLVMALVQATTVVVLATPEDMEMVPQYEEDPALNRMLEDMMGENDNNMEDYGENPEDLKKHLANYVAKRFSEFVGGKRFSEFLGGKKRFSEFLGGKKRFSEFLGGKKRFSEFLGGKKRFSEFLGGKKRFSEFLGGKKRFSEFLGGKRDGRSVDSMMMKRDLEFLGGR